MEEFPKSPFLLGIDVFNLKKFNKILNMLDEKALVLNEILIMKRLKVIVENYASVIEGKKCIIITDSKTVNYAIDYN